MGWTAGKGLGAKENGIVEHVVARYKNDEKGLGFEDRNDQWTKHEDDFNSLLANLSNANDVNQVKLHSGISLEDKSKKSKARIHYHKFTRGKDLSRYSEKDLANIFGKKSFKEEAETEKSLDNNVKITEQVFTEKGSMEDYFKNKITAFKSKTNILRKEDKTNKDLDDEAICGFQGFLGTTDEKIISDNSPSLSHCNIDNNAQIKSIENNTAINECENLPKTKKKKKEKCREVTQEVMYNNEDEEPQKVIEYAKTKRDSKDDSPVQERIPEIQEQKKCKKLRQEKNTNEEAYDTEDIIYKPKKKKKRKNKDL
ncbi:unnamed protein product [Parnassius apollo]|uniref:(apollo) hypothetical protein n=1 Tax=Parnassius apollo TaxID=110799 RepID=A0A8S3XEC1_PARAO|nr:unnamed protein product [Parnassius apollo]